MDNGTERHQLYTFLMDNNVPDGCSGNSPARLFALQAAVAMPQGEVDFEDRIIVRGDFEIAFPCQTDIIRNTLETESSLNALIANTFDMDDEDSVDLIYSSEALTEGELDLIGAKADIVFYNPGNPNSPYYISVNFDQDYLLYATDLSIASVILHENVHAYLLYALEENEDWLVEFIGHNR